MHDSLTFWQRIKIKRRISIVDDHTLNELWSFRLSGMNLIITLTLLFIITLVLLSLAVIYTPVRNVLPGYNQNLREQLMTQTDRLDSLSNSVQLQQQYLSVIRDITAGQVSTDSVQSLDTMQIMAQEQLLQAKMEATEEFMDQYEQKEKDYLQLFDVQNVTPAVTLFKPAHGVVIPNTPSGPLSKGVTIKTPDKENITAVLAGTIVYVNYELDNTYTMVMQHTNYISIYRGLGVVTKPLGSALKAGETMGIVGKENILEFELWKEGVAINPEEVIVF